MQASIISFVNHNHKYTQTHATRAVATISCSVKLATIYNSLVVKSRRQRIHTFERCFFHEANASHSFLSSSFLYLVQDLHYPTDAYDASDEPSRSARIAASPGSALSVTRPIVARISVGSRTCHFASVCFDEGPTVQAKTFSDWSSFDLFRALNMSES